MTKLGLPSDFAKKIADALEMTSEGVDEFFEVEEDKQGFFVAKLKPKKFLDTPQFRAMCTLARDLGGESYLQGAKAWRVPGPYANTASAPEAPMPLAPALALPSASQASDVRGKPLPYMVVPLKALLSMPFQTRLIQEDGELPELAESVRAFGVLEPVLVRPKSDGFFEVVAGGRRVRAAERAGLVEVPVVVRELSDEEASVVELTENFQRKDLSEEEKSRALGELARRYSWSAQQIADKLKMSYQWVVKYLPSEFKAEQQSEAGKASGLARAESVLRRGTDSQESVASLAPNSESQDTALERRAESEDMRQEPEQRKTIPCVGCGRAVEAPVALAGKFYCESCAVKAETEPKEVPVKAPGAGFEPATPAGPLGPEPEALKAIQIGEFDCTECKQHFVVEHLPNGEHKLRFVREASE